MTGRPAAWAVGWVVGPGAVSIVIVGSEFRGRLGRRDRSENGRPFLLLEGSQGVPLSRRRTCPDLAPCRLDAGRLSWLHRAGPSATLDKSSSVVRGSYGACPERVNDAEGPGLRGTTVLAGSAGGGRRNLPPFRASTRCFHSSGITARGDARYRGLPPAGRVAGTCLRFPATAKCFHSSGTTVHARPRDHVPARLSRGAWSAVIGIQR